MKIIIIGTIGVILLVGFANSVDLEPRFVRDKFETFKRSFARRYSNNLEEQLRKQIFKNRLQEIEEHNSKFRKGLETYEVEVNEFTDLTDEEFQEKFISGLQLPEEMPEPLYNVSSTSQRRVSAPASFDWRAKGAVNPVKDQKSCGSCWAFSAIGTLESHYKIKYGKLLRFSEQQLVDCVGNNNNCNGGWMATAFIYIAKNGGVNYEGNYPYQGVNGACRYNPKNPHPTIRGYAYLTGVNENLLKETIAGNGPVTAAIEVSGNFNSYKSGVYYNSRCGSNVNHGVVIVGYGSENGQDYWLVRNSWGASWGSGGYIKMARNRGNNCQIATYPYWPVF